MTEAQELLDELAGLASTLAPVFAPAGDHELLQSLTATAAALFGAGACSLAVLTEDEDELVYVAASGAGADSVVGMRITAGTGIAGYVVQTGQPVAISDLRNDARFARDVAQDTGYVPQAILAVPVNSATEQLGVLTLLDRDANRDGAQFDLQTATLFAEQAGLAIEAARRTADVGGQLLTALADAAGAGTSLRSALTAAVDRPVPRAGADIVQVAALLSELAARSPAHAQLAVRVLQEFVRADLPRAADG